MAVLNGAFENVLGNPIALAVISVLFVVLLGGYVFNQRRGSCGLLPVPKVPGVPLLGNLLQLKEKKPYKTFTKWAEIHGPIYSIQLGSSYMIVLNSTEVAKEAMVTRFPSISTRKLSNALTILTHDKRMVATSDYNEFHKTVKRLVVTHLLGSNAQKRNKHLRETMVQHMVDNFSAHAKKNPLQAVNFREIFQYENFGLALKQAIGRDVQSLYVKELGTTLSRKDIFHVLVLDMMEGAIEVDWRDFFPYLRWVPNKKMETKIKSLDFRRQAVIEALIREHKDQTHARETISCYLDSLLSEENILSHSEVTMLLWEPIIETSDTTLITTEWAMFELAKNPDRQDRLYQEIQEVCGSEEITEEHLLQIPYLGAIFHETLRKHSPVPIIPIRYVHEDTRIGGFHVPAGSEICINLYGCNMDKTQWDNPEDWNPERFLDTKYDPQDLYKTMAFGAGKRICAGSLQAMSVACLSIGRFVQEFEWRLPPGVEEDVDTVGLTSHKLHPLHAIAKPRH